MRASGPNLRRKLYGVWSSRIVLEITNDPVASLYGQCFSGPVRFANWEWGFFGGEGEVPISPLNNQPSSQ